MKQTRDAPLDLRRLPPAAGRRAAVRDHRRHLVKAPAPLTRHQIVVGNLRSLLELRPRRGLGEVLVAPCDVILADDVVLQPDLLFVSEARRTIIKERGIFGPPDLAIEILSKGSVRRDTVRKLGLYGRYGIREYWIVDPDEDRIEVFVLEDGQLVRKARHASGQREVACGVCRDSRHGSRRCLPRTDQAGRVSRVERNSPSPCRSCLVDEPDDMLGGEVR